MEAGCSAVRSRPEGCRGHQDEGRVTGSDLVRAILQRLSKKVFVSDPACHAGMHLPAVTFGLLSGNEKALARTGGSRALLS